MEPNTLKVKQIKEMLQRYGLPTYGRKAELIRRMQQQDPSGAWRHEAAQHPGSNEDEDTEEDTEEAPAVAPYSHQEEQNQMRREHDLLTRERDLMRREMELLRRENEILRASPQASTSSTASKTMISIKNVAELLSEYSGQGEEFSRWRAQVNFLRATYELDNQAAKILAGSKLKEKAFDWYHSRSEYLAMDLDDLLKEMEIMFDQPLGRVEARRRFESRQWQRDETFADYCHSKIILGNRIPVADDELVDYVIEGIPHEDLRNQALINSFSTVQELMAAFKKVRITGYNSGGGRISQSSNKSDPRRGSRDKTPQYQNKFKETEKQRPATARQRSNTRGVTRCYQCDEVGHYARDCKKEKKKREAAAAQDVAAQGTLPKEKRPDRQVGIVDDEEDPGESDESQDEKEDLYVVDLSDSQKNDFKTKIDIEVEGNEHFEVIAQVDTGCPISLIKRSIVDRYTLSRPGKEWHKYCGINRSPLQVIGVIETKVTLDQNTRTIRFGVVTDLTMAVPAIIGRDTLTSFGYKLTKHLEYDQAVTNLLNIGVHQIAGSLGVNINSEVSLKTKENFERLFEEYYRKPDRPSSPQVYAEAVLTLKNSKPIQFGPRRISFADKSKLRDILDNLLSKGTIRESTSEYSSPIVLTHKKNGETRMCVDFRELNKIIASDRYPLPLIEDQLDSLRGKRFFSTLDLTDGFYHVHMSPDSIKYTSFITPLGQFEFVKMPFGLKIGPQRFQRFINKAMDALIKTGNVVVYMDDILVATEDLDTHLKTLKDVFTALVNNKLELRLDKCFFLYTGIEYLGYYVDKEGVRPTDGGISAVKEFPEPKTIKELHSFVGLASYFRKFIKDFSIIAKPLYSLLKKEASFNFGEEQRAAFNILKEKLVGAPTLAIYDPKAPTELHCDASSHGFGAVLLQRQPDKKLHPVFYFSKRTSAVETRYHSFELETLAIIYAVRRFKIYLQGIPFIIVTDCNAVAQTLDKRDINSRIARWSLELQNFDFRIVHRQGSRMGHVDALSRTFGVLVIEDNPFEWNLTILQSRDPVIRELMLKLETGSDPHYELRNGLVYKKQEGNLLFLVPELMERHVLFRYHNEMGHVGINKMVEAIRRTYWFTRIKEKCEEHIRHCLKCISFAPVSGKTEGSLFPIPKGNVPFDTVHIDHYGPVDPRVVLKKHIFLVVDAFSKFVRLYATKTTNSREAIACLTQFFQSYNKPKIIISDRGSSFTSNEFGDFLKSNDIKHVKIATGSPQANGQVERINRIITPMLAKLTDLPRGKIWPKLLPAIEYSVNNTVNRSTGRTPSQIVFGLDQRSSCNDNVKDFLDNINGQFRDLDDIRNQSAHNVAKAQQKQKLHFDQRHKVPLTYEVGDLVMIRNFDCTPGIPKKLIPQFRGPYEVVKTLRNHRYLIADPPGFQNTQRPYEGTWEARNMRLYKKRQKEKQPS